MMKLHMGYPDRASQVSILRDRCTGDPLESVESVLNWQQLEQVIELVANTYGSL